MQIAGGSAVFAGFAFAGDADGLAIMHAGGNFDDDGSLAKLPAGAAAVGAMLANDGSASAAIGAGDHHAEHSAKSLLRDASLPAALQADDRRGARLGAGAAAMFAAILSFKIDRLFRAAGDFLQRQFDARFQIVSARWPAARRRARPPPPSAPPKMSSNIEKMSVTSMCEKSCWPVTPCMAELIVPPALAVVGKDFVGFGAFLEFDLGLGLVAVGAVGMKFHRQPAIGALDLLAVGGSLRRRGLRNNRACWWPRLSFRPTLPDVIVSASANAQFQSAFQVVSRL